MVYSTVLTFISGAFTMYGFMRLKEYIQNELHRRKIYITKKNARDAFEGILVRHFSHLSIGDENVVTVYLHKLRGEEKTQTFYVPHNWYSYLKIPANNIHTGYVIKSMYSGDDFIGFKVIYNENDDIDSIIRTLH
jgi:hypothetical protein